MAYLEMSEYGPDAHDVDANQARRAEADALERRVWDSRRAKLGREHPYTLWAQCNYARIRAARGAFDEAEELIRSGLVVATRNLGPEHIGTLYGRMYLGRLFMQRGDHEEGEKELKGVIEAQGRMAAADSRGEHPDRLQTLFYLQEGLRTQGRRGRRGRRARKSPVGLPRLEGRSIRS